MVNIDNILTIKFDNRYHCLWRMHNYLVCRIVLGLGYYMVTTGNQYGLKVE